MGSGTSVTRGLGVIDRMNDGEKTDSTYWYSARRRAEDGSDDKPKHRETLAESGPQSLSDAELVATILGRGISGTSVDELAEDVLGAIDSAYFAPGQPRRRWLSGIRGIGPAKASAIEAALELGRRYFPGKGRKIRGPRDVWLSVAHYADRPQEHFLALSLNGAHELAAKRVISIGLVNRTMVHPREVFSDIIKERSCSVVVAHNHPSGNLEPSPEDLQLTERLYDSGKLLGIELLDHIVFSEEGFMSMKEAGEFDRFE
jgi:DNA repair protein RadC